MYALHALRARLVIAYHVLRVLNNVLQPFLLGLHSLIGMLKFPQQILVLLISVPLHKKCREYFQFVKQIKLSLILATFYF